MLIEKMIKRYIYEVETQICDRKDLKNRIQNFPQSKIFSCFVEFPQLCETTCCYVESIGKAI